MLFQAVEGQEKGIIFTQEDGWDKILSVAKIENKFILVDCYTTWCGPCKYMEAETFPNGAVGEFYNDKFICVKFQIDTTVNDPEKIKLRYKNAAFIKNKYKINGFPTYLFFNPSGELVHRTLGSCPPEEFIAVGTKALDPEKQYYTQIGKYETGNRNALFLKKLTLLALDANDESVVSEYAKAYYATQKNLLDTSNLFFVYQSTSNVADTGFKLMCNNLKKFEPVVGKGRLHTSLKFIIIRSEFLLNNQIGNDWNNNKWSSYGASLSKKYPLFSRSVLLQFKLMTFPRTNNWKGYADAVKNYLTMEYPGNAELNEYAWTIFGKCNDKSVLEMALVSCQF